MRATLPTGWSIEVPDDFSQVDNGDSWQAYNEDQSRIVYLASMVVEGPYGPPSPEELIEVHDVDDPDVIEYRIDWILGRAHISRDDGGVEIKGLSCVPGRIATSVISLTNEQDVPWALDVWRSIRFEPRKRARSSRRY